MKKFNLENLCHYADILAIPLFFLTFWYFYELKNKTYEKNRENMNEYLRIE
jgi:hypothetical protein